MKLIIIGIGIIIKAEDLINIRVDTKTVAVLFFPFFIVYIQTDNEGLFLFHDHEISGYAIERSEII